MTVIEKQIMEEVLVEHLQSFLGRPNTPETRKEIMDYLFNPNLNSSTDGSVLH